MFDYETRPYIHIMQVEDVSAKNAGYTLGQVPFDIGMMFIMGLLYRVVAYLLMRFGDRKIIAE